MNKPLRRLPEELTFKIVKDTNLAGCLALQNWEATQQFLDSDQAAMDLAVRLGSIPAIKMLSQNCIGVPNIDVAARYGHMHVVKYLTAMERGLDGCKRTTDAMDNAAIFGHLEIMKWLHKNCSEGFTEKALLGPLVAGNAEVVEWVWDHFTERSEGPAKWVNDDGAETDAFKWLQENVPVIAKKRKRNPGSMSPSPRIEALKYVLSRGWKLDPVIPKLAAARGQLSLLSFLDSRCHMDSKVDYITTAATYDQDSVVHWLVYHSNQRDYFNEALAIAASRHRWRMQQFLISQGGIYDPHSVLLKGARLNHDEPHFRGLLYCPDRTHVGMEYDSWYELFMAAASGKGAAALAVLYHEYAHHEGRLDRHAKPAEAAAANGNLEAIQWLIQEDWNLNLHVVELAARNGHHTVLEVLDDNWYILPYDSYGAGYGPEDSDKVYHAWWMDEPAGNGQLPVVKFIVTKIKAGQQELLQNLKFGGLDDSEKARGQAKYIQRLDDLSIALGEALNKAAENGHMHVVRWLEAETGWKCSLEAIVPAASNGHLDIVRLLVRRGGVSESVRAEVRQTAEQHGHHHIVRWLHRMS